MTMLAGRYWVGDLCYVMHDEWKEVCDLIIDGHDVHDGEFTLADGRRFAIYSTAYGDGSYTNNHNSDRLCVDSGSIGCIRLEDIDQDNTQNDIASGIVVEFERPFSTSGGRGDNGWDGTIHIGHVEVYTGDDPYYDEEEEYSYYEDEDY